MWEPPFELRKHYLKSRGILHLGGYKGVEGLYYNTIKKPVLWVEALPPLYNQLVKNIENCSNQIALQALLMDRDGEETTFYISNNKDGMSSSIFKFGKYATGEKSLWPELNLHMRDSIKLTSSRLDTLVETNNIDVSKYDFWLVDLQGAELLALKGSSRSLQYCNEMFIEVSKNEVYEGGVQWQELKEYLKEQGFIPLKEPKDIHQDILFHRDNK